MPDRPTFDARLADAFERYVHAAPVGVDAMAMTTAASAAALPRRSDWSSARLLLAAGLLLAGLIAASFVATGGHPLGLFTVTAPSPVTSPVHQTSPAPTLAGGAPAWEAIYVRTDPIDSASIDVVAVRPDGEERLLRRIGTAIKGSDLLLSPTSGRGSENGWLALGTTSFRDSFHGAWVLFDLAHPSRESRIVPSDGELTARWSSDGLFAVAGNPCCWKVEILDPRTGASTDLGKIGLFGGGPSIVWAQDGSGILDFGRMIPAQGGKDIDVDPNLLFADRRVGAGFRTIDICSPDQTYNLCPSATEERVRVTDSKGTQTDWFVSRDKNEQPVGAIFANDGRSLLVTLDRVSGQRHTAVIGRMDNPGHFLQLGMFDLPPGAWGPELGQVDPSDSIYSLWYLEGSTDNPQSVMGPLLHADGTISPAPRGTFAGYVSGQLAESWPALGEFGPPQSASPQP